MTIDDKGAISEGFNIAVQPAAIHGASLDTTWFTGQFHGVMRPQTPIGSWRIMNSPCKYSKS